MELEGYTEVHEPSSLKEVRKNNLQYFSGKWYKPLYGSHSLHATISGLLKPKVI